TLDEETLLRGDALQSAAPEELVAKTCDPFPRPVPEGGVVLLERHVIHVVLDPSHERQEDPADVDVAPMPMPAQGPSSPHPNAAAGKAHNGVDADVVQLPLILRRDLELHIHHALDNFVRRRLVDAHLRICPCVDTRDMTARRYPRRPGPVERPDEHPRPLPPPLR